MARIDDDGSDLGLPSGPEQDNDSFQQRIEETRQAADELVAAVNESARRHQSFARVRRTELGISDVAMAAVAGFLAGYVAAQCRSR